jgi:putative hydrolase of the HAD superfamily
MKKIQCVIFDFGGVIGYPHDKERVKKMAKLVEMPMKEFKKEYFHHRIAYDAGVIDKYTYWNRITGKCLELKKVDELVKEDYQSWTRINYNVVELIQSLKGKVQKIVLLSNINIDAKTYVKEELELFEMFDAVYCSCDLKLMKPHRDIYEYVIESLRVLPEHCVFIDDIQENIIGAKEAGLHGIMYENYEQLKEKLRQYEIV